MSGETESYPCPLPPYPLDNQREQWDEGANVGGEDYDYGGRGVLVVGWQSRGGMGGLVGRGPAHA